jgi:hypothetical protein
VAFAYLHEYNGVNHGLTQHSELAWAYAAVTDPPEINGRRLRARHYFEDGSYNRQCYRATYGAAPCSDPVGQRAMPEALCRRNGRPNAEALGSPRAELSGRYPWVTR